MKRAKRSTAAAANEEANRRQVKLFVPGRLCLFGEHCDWAAEYGRHRGFCMVIGTDQGLSATATPLPKEFAVRTHLPDSRGRSTKATRQTRSPWDAEVLRESAGDQSDFFRYCAGVAYQMSSHPHVPGGIDLRITRMDLPLQKGVSSSAAVCILVAQAFDGVYQLGMFPHELMEVAYLGEKRTGSQCGRMDQACIYGKTPVLLTFQKSDDIRVEPIFPAKEIHMFFVDLAGKKDTVKILKDLQNAYAGSPKLQEALGPANERIIRAAYRALSAGDAKELGGLMIQAQRIFDALVAPHSPAELASPLLHRVLKLRQITRHIWGGKGVGSQGDGTAQFVARSAADREVAMNMIAKAFPQMQCFPLTITKAHPRR